MISRYMAAAAVNFILASFNAQATAASFEVIEETGGPLCWMRVGISENLSLSVFTEQDSDSDELTMLVEDDETDPQSFPQQGDTLQISITLENGEELSFWGSYDEELAGSVADAKIGQIGKLINQRNWKFAIENLSPVTAHDILEEDVFKAFLACTNR